MSTAFGLDISFLKTFRLIISEKPPNTKVDVPEWLSGMTRNHVGSARAGSNPAVHVFLALLYSHSSTNL